jgi:4-amino-4-deoxy-L-arabinose transferase-like glycosyltransferase
MWTKIRANLALPAVIVLAAFLFRLALIYSASVAAPLPIHDRIPFGYETGAVAASIAEGKGFSSPLGVESGPTAWFTPVYPYIVALVFKLFGAFTHSSALVLLTLNSAFSALTCWPIFLIAERFSGRGVAAGSAWVWVFLPTATKFPIQWVWDTSLSALLLALLCLATLRISERTGMRSWLGYGLLWALGVMTNPALISLLPFFAAWALLRAKTVPRKKVQLALVSCLAFSLACAPWFVRNYRAFGQIVFFRSNFGLELWLGNNDLVPDVWTPYLHPNENDVERAKFVRKGEIAYMAEKKSLALDFIRKHPADVTELVFFRVMNNWTDAWGPPVQLFLHSTWMARAGLLWNCLFSLLAFAGVFLARRSRLRGSPLFASALLVFPLTYYITHTALRYRHPIDPIMTILAVYSVARLVEFLSRKLLKTRIYQTARVLV